MLNKWLCNVFHFLFKMKTDILLVCFLLCMLLLPGSGTILPEINKSSRKCKFALSNGGYEEFLSAVPLFENCTRRFQNAALEIKLLNYTLPAFPNGTFTNLPFLNSFRLEISKDSKIHLLSPLLPSYFVFKNLEFRSAVIDISHSSPLAGWKWEALSEIKYERIERFEFVVMRSKIIYLPSSFGDIANSKVTTIRILSCQLRWLGKNVFGPFSNLMFLELRDNFLEKFERSHLPRKAPRLHSLDLGKNRLQYISPDLFTDFNLKRIFLDGNNIKILSNLVNTILAAHSLDFINGIIWPCGCSQIVKLSKKFLNFSDEKCYVNDKGIKVKDFMKDSCGLQLY